MVILALCSPNSSNFYSALMCLLKYNHIMEKTKERMIIIIPITYTIAWRRVCSIIADDGVTVWSSTVSNLIATNKTIFIIKERTYRK